MSANSEIQQLWFEIVKLLHEHPLQWVSALPTYTAPPTNMTNEQPLLVELVSAVNHNI